ncbi:MAG: hypothetical protein P4L59_13820 [Desulfosporosinus sp.]|nr:hypothetical protein [Desulfosporosinus sp.]
MRNLKVLLTCGLVIGTCLFSALPAMADTPTGSTATNAQYWSQIKQLRQTDKGLGDQLTSLRQSNAAQRKTDWAQKNYIALLAAKQDQIKFVTDYTTALTDRFALEKDTIQLQLDRQNKNATGITTGLQNIITDLNNQITIRTQLVSDVTTVLTDLGGSVTPPVPAV